MGATEQLTERRRRAKRDRNAVLRVPTSVLTILALIVAIDLLAAQTWALPHTRTPSGWYSPEISLSIVAALTWAVATPLERYWLDETVPEPSEFAFRLVPRLMLGLIFVLLLVGALIALEALGVGRPLL